MYHIVKVAVAHGVDIVEDRLLPILKLRDAEESIGAASTIESARELAREKGYPIRHVVQVPYDISEKLAVFLLKAAKENGIDENRAITALLPLMSSEAKKRFLS